jgi:PAS domain S-box-containing protein
LKACVYDLIEERGLVVPARKTAEARLLLLSKVSALAESIEYESILGAVARLSIPDLADWTIIDVVEHGARRPGAVAHRDPAKLPLVEQLLHVTPPLREMPAWREVLEGRSRLLDPTVDHGMCGDEDSGAREMIRKLDGRSALIVPFVVLGQTVAVATLVMAADSGRRHEPEDLRLAEELARRAGQIIENARLHQELRRSEARFRVALEHARISVFEEDTDFVVRWLYSPHLGALADAVVGKRVTEQLPPEEAAQLEGLKRQLLATGQGVRVELHPSLDGARQYIVVHYEPLRDASGAIVGLAGAGIDVTEVREAQEELTEALAFREKMMGVLGHDLRNPLGAVSGLAGLLLLQGELPQTAREGLKRIGQSARRMNEMIETLVDFTQSRFHGSLPVERQAVDLVEVVRGVIEELRAAHPDRDIRIDGSERVLGEWDPARMAQVVSNLVGNALTHGDRDAPVELSLVAGAGDAALRVTNRGPAIPPELMARLFEPFRRGAAGGNGGRGLGLGLYIAREIVRAHGGSIAVESGDECTTFSVRLSR